MIIVLAYGIYRYAQGYRLVLITAYIGVSHGISVCFIRQIHSLSILVSLTVYTGVANGIHLCCLSFIQIGFKVHTDVGYTEFHFKLNF